jgi:hypothetical protein
MRVTGQGGQFFQALEREAPGWSLHSELTLELGWLRQVTKQGLRSCVIALRRALSIDFFGGPLEGASSLHLRGRRFVLFF